MHLVKCKFRKVCGRFIIHLDQITKALIKHVILKIISNTRKIFTPLSHRSSTRFSIHCHQCDFLLHGCFQRDLHWSSKCMRAIFERVLSHQGFPIDCMASLWRRYFSTYIGLGRPSALGVCYCQFCNQTALLLFAKCLWQCSQKFCS